MREEGKGRCAPNHSLLTIHQGKGEKQMWVN
jgi:hypothetical protein